MWFLALYIFAKLFWRDRNALVKQPTDRRVVSLIYRELSKMISRKYTFVRNHIYDEISSWFLYMYICPKCVRLELNILIRSNVTISATNFERIFWRACETLVKHPLVGGEQANQKFFTKVLWQPKRVDAGYWISLLSRITRFPPPAVSSPNTLN